MALAIIQTSFNSGEWSPNLNARVDMKQYHSGAALLRNFFVDYRGGATASPGTKYILQAYIPSKPVRLIPFQASSTVSYMLEFGENYMRPYNNGAPILEVQKAITNISQANPGVVTSNAHGYSNGDIFYVANVIGMTRLNGSYFTAGGVTANTFELHNLQNVNVDTTTYTAYVSGGTASRVYKIASPYTGAELAQVKFTQDVNKMEFCHPNYPTYHLILTSAANWTMAAVTIGSTVAAPTGQAVVSTLGAGTWNYAYVITAVDVNGQESAPSAFATIATLLDLRTTAGTNTITWSAVTGAASYNVYKAELRSGASVPAGAQFGFAGNCTATTFIDSNIGPDFAQGPPVVNNPFSGTGIQSITVTNAGSYAGLIVPTISFTGGAPGAGATAIANVQATAIAINAVGFGYNVFDTINLVNGIIIQVISVNIGGTINAISIVNAGSISIGPVPSNPSGVIATSGTGSGATFNITWGVTSVGITSPGTGYTPTPAVVFSVGAATATATLGAPSSGNPTVPIYHQQRLGLLGPVASPNQTNFSQPGASYNFNVTNPIQPDNAFQGTLKSGQLNTIQSAISQPQGLIVLTDVGAWLLNGGSAGSAFDATNLVANAQVFSGAAGLPPIVATDDILYVQSKGSIVRDLVFNFNKQVYTGMDISVMSSHLFYGYQLLEWAWAEEPFKIIWAVRNDGTLLSLTFLKEQELIAWTHRDTQGAFKSIATITEVGPIGNVNAIYVVVQRTVNGSSVQYIERMVEQYYPNGVTDAWQIDSGLQYNGSAALVFTGAEHLSAATITGLATDNLGNVAPFTATVSSTGIFQITPPTSPATGWTRVTAGLPYIPQLITLGIDTGDPTIQGKMKKLPQVTVRVANTLGLSIGTDFDNLVDLDDLVIGNVGKDTNALVTNLVTGDALQALDPAWTVPGQYCIQQSLPYPATILGLIPQIAIGDSKDTG